MPSMLSIYRILKRTGKERRELGERVQENGSPNSSHKIVSWAAVRYVQETQPLVENKREPPIGDPCERCDGACYLSADEAWDKCPRCLGTGVQP